MQPGGSRQYNSSFPGARERPQERLQQRLQERLQERADELADARADLAQWATPLASDRIACAYDFMLGEIPALCEPLWRQHGGFWRLILDAETARARVARAHLLALAQIARIGPEAVDAVDRLVLDELMDVVAARFQRSPANTRRYGRLLIDAVARLTETRLLAA